MRIKEDNSRGKRQDITRPLTPEEKFLKTEEAKKKHNREKNKPIIFITYIMVLVFMGLFGSIIYFMQFKSELVIANSHNKRQDTFAENVEKGDIITSDGVVIATSTTDSNGVTTRSYPHKNLFAHLIGYDKYGRAGLELQGNFYMLRSHTNPIEQARNEVNGTKNRGDNLVTTVNYNLQKVASDALGGARGAVLVMEPSTGKILCMVSKPDYDPNNIDYLWDYTHSTEGQSETFFLNRATQGKYAPGSTFKIIGLLEYYRENPTTYQNYSYTCNSSIRMYDVTINCYEHTVHGNESLKDSLANSCNASFVNLSQNFDLKSFRSLCNDLYFNEELPVDFECSKSQFTLNENSPKNQLPATAIGQGETLMTPLHNLMIGGAIANGGVMMKPYIIDHIENDDGRVVKRFKPKSLGSVMTADEAEFLTDYMSSVTTYGTATWYFSGASYVCAGKTGTAEKGDGNVNTWFVGFANADNPEVVVSVITEDYNKTGVKAVAVARTVIDAYYTYCK